jgi:hypothetical protein
LLRLCEVDDAGFRHLLLEPKPKLGNFLDGTLDQTGLLIVEPDFGLVE